MFKTAPSCLVCNSDRSSAYLDLQIPARRLAYLRCPECSLVFQDPADFAKAEEIYDAEYIQKRGQDPFDPAITRSREKTAEYYFRWMEKYAPKGNVLDVGCATGLALKVAQDRGWKAFGVDVNEDAVRTANSVLKSGTVKTGHLNDRTFPDNFFSLITLFDVIEHIPDPLDFLSVLHKKTAPGGFIFFLTPNVDTLSFKIMKNKWPFFIQEHFLLYSHQSISRLLKETGFKLAAHGWGRKYMSIQILREHAQGHLNPLYRSVGWVLGKAPYPKAVFPFNIGEMYVLAQKI